MKKQTLENYLDLQQADIDPEWFAAALTIKHVCQLVVHGGSEWGQPADEETLHPHHLEAFLSRAVSIAHETNRFEEEWHSLQYFVPVIKYAWEQGQALFQEDLAQVIKSEEEMEYLSQIDFAVDCYASVSALKTYPDNKALQAWLINGYMLAWRHHFLDNEERALL